MSIGFWCLLISAMLIYIAKIPVAWAMQREGGYDNHHPRSQQANLSGLGARALAAHQNSIEAFPIFAAGVLVATSVNASAAWISVLSLLFIASRILYLICYWADWHWQRTLVWSFGLLSSLLLLLSPAVFAIA